MNMRKHFRTSVARAGLLILLATASAAPAERLPGHVNLFNGDCNFLFFEGRMADPNAPFDKQSLRAFIDLLADSGVDTYLLNPNGQVPWYPSKRTPNILTGYKRGDREFFR